MYAAMTRHHAHTHTSAIAICHSVAPLGKDLFHSYAYFLSSGVQTWAETRGQWPHRLAIYRAMKMAADLKQASSITLVSMCMLPLVAVLVASEAMAASK